MSKPEENTPRFPDPIINIDWLRQHPEVVADMQAEGEVFGYARGAEEGTKQDEVVDTWVEIKKAEAALRKKKRDLMIKEHDPDFKEQYAEFSRLAKNAVDTRGKSYNASTPFLQEEILAINLEKVQNEKKAPKSGQPKAPQSQPQIRRRI
jgi:hypothetical protein